MKPHDFVAKDVRFTPALTGLGVLLIVLATTGESDGRWRAIAAVTLISYVLLSMIFSWLFVLYVRRQAGDEMHKARRVIVDEVDELELAQKLDRADQIRVHLENFSLQTSTPDNHFRELHAVLQLLLVVVVVLILGVSLQPWAG